MVKIERKERQPDYLIIGAQKSGTTSLYAYLNQHPQVVPAEKKEVHFFDLNFSNGVEWYRQQFARMAKSISPENESYSEDKYIRGFITGEASPYYVFHPLVPQRVYQTFPQVKLILLLRNPVNRAISHYYHEVKLGFESLSLEDAIAQEETRLQDETEKLLTQENYYSFNHQHYTYLSRGKYVEQLTNWLKFFPKEQMLIIKTEELDSQPDMIMDRVWEFLKLPPRPIVQYEKYNSNDYPPVDETLYNQLTSYFQPDNQKLQDSFGISFD